MPHKGYRQTEEHIKKATEARKLPHTAFQKGHIPWNAVKFTRDDFITIYIDQDKSTKECAEIFKVNVETIRRYIRKWNLPRKSRMTKSFTRNDLVDLYVNQALNQADVARILGFKHSDSIGYYLDKWNIPRKPRSEIFKAFYAIPENRSLLENHRRPVYHDKYESLKDEIIDLYVNQQLNGREIAKKLGVDRKAIYIRIRRYGIQKSPNQIMKEHYSKHPQKSFELDRDVLYKHYIVDKMGIPEIAKLYNVSTHPITDLMEKYNIPRRSFIEAAELRDFFGPNNPCWRDGRGLEPYPIGWGSKILKNKIRERDNYTCQKCGITQEQCGEKLSIHHIDYIKENIDLNNLISLCRRCNAVVNFKREYWTQYFQELMEEKTAVA